MWTRTELKQNAKNVLKKWYWKFVVVGLLYSIMTGTLFSAVYQFSDIFVTTDAVVDPNIIMTESFSFMLLTFFISCLFGCLYGIFIGNPLLVGLYRYCIQARNGVAVYSDLFFAFRNNYWNHVKILFLMNLKIVLWMLLFIVPGIIKSYEYYMIPFLLAENANISSEDAFYFSKKCTEDEKFNIFILEFSFVGWLFLGALMCGVGVLFVNPYLYATLTELYLRLVESKNIFIERDLPPVPSFEN